MRARTVSLHFRILGPLEVERGGRPVSVGAAKHRTLLAILLLHENEVVGMQRLIDELWGSRPPPSAHKLVQGYVSSLRKTLGDGDGAVLATRPPGYLLRVERGRVDLHEFERLLDDGRLREALGLWRGGALADVEFEGAARAEAERLNDLRLASLEERIDADLARGQDSALVRELETLVREHPYRERFREQLMLALYRAGRQADALAVFRDTRRLLIDELGIEPGPRLRELETAILRHDESLARPAPGLPRRLVRRVPVLAALVIALLAVTAAAAFVLVRSNRTAAPPPLRLLPNALALIDAERNEFVAQVPLGAGGTDLALDDGTIWVANGNESVLLRIDAKTRRMTGRIGLGSTIMDIAVGEGSVWVVTAAPALLRIDPASMRPVKSLRLPGRPFLEDPQTPVLGGAPRLAIAAGSLWVTDRATLLRIDPKTVSIVARIPLRTHARDIASGGAGIWILDSRRNVLKVDPLTNRVTARLKLRAGGARLAVGGDDVWVAAFLDDAVWRIDPLGGRPPTIIETGYRPFDVAAADEAVWVTSYLEPAIRRIDPETNRVVATFRPPFFPFSVAADAEGAWVLFGTG